MLRTSYNHSILGFIPALVVQYLLEKKSKRSLPEKQTFKSVVLFADISGFTNLSETLSRKGNEGSELLAFVLNRYMELLVKIISRSGGDIFKFAGDAMIVLWPPPASGPNFERDLTILCRQAVQSALDIKNRLNDAILFEKTKLSVKMGLGIGDLTIMHVGGTFSRAEYLVAGNPLTQAFESEHHATSGGQIIVSKQIWDIIRDYVSGEELKDHDEHHISENGPFVLINQIKIDRGSAVQKKADALLIKQHISEGEIQSINKIIETYIPKAVLTYILYEEEKWSSELRRLTVMFLNLGIDLSAAETADGLKRVQKVIQTVQQCVYQGEGSLNKLLMDDKGSTLIVVFGLPPMGHQDDAVRGVLTAFRLRAELKKINCSCSVGITTGLVFAGVVGTSGNRREYSVLGDSVNLSARLMQAACKEKERKILVDEETKKEAEHKISFKFFECRTVKGKSGQIPFYEPIDTNEVQLKPLGLNNFPELRTHCYNIPYSTNIILDQYKDALYMLGRKAELSEAKSHINEFLENPGRGNVILIKGAFGIGKTLFIRCVLESILENIKHINEKKKWKDPISVIISTLNCLTMKKKVNAWRLVAKQLLEKLESRYQMNHREIMEKKFELDKQAIDCIEDLLGLDRQKEQEKEIVIGFEKFEDQEEKRTIVDFFRALIDLTVSEGYGPLVLVMDDAQLFDKVSWKVLNGLIKEKQPKILITVILRDHHEEKVNDSKIFQEISEAKKKCLTLIQNLIKNPPHDYKLSKIYLKGINLLESQELIKKLLGVFEVADNLLFFLYQKSSGNPLDVIHMIQCLVRQDFVEKNMDSLLVTESLLRLFEIEDYITINAPLSRVKINSPIIDSLSCGEVLIMKQASVIGETFDLQTLIKINNFQNDLLSNDKLPAILLELEKKEFIGMVDEQNNNIVYQFSHPFMREVLYQRMIYSQRRHLHRLVAEAIQTVSNVKAKVGTEMELMQEKIECEKLVFHWRLAENRNEEEESLNNDPMKDPYKNGGFSNLAKRSIIVKKISSSIGSMPGNLSQSAKLKSGYLQMKTFGAYSFKYGWNTRWFVLNFKELKIYNSESDYTDHPDRFASAISLKHIFSIAFLDENETGNKQAFCIKAGSMWTNTNTDLGFVQLYLSDEKSDNIEEWATYIEFSRAKAIYDDFVNTFGKISFPLGEGENKPGKKSKPVITSGNFYNNKKSNQSKSSARRSVFEPSLDRESQKHERLKEQLDFFLKRGLAIFFSTVFQAAHQREGQKKLKLGKNNNYIHDKKSYFIPEEKIFRPIEIMENFEGEQGSLNKAAKVRQSKFFNRKNNPQSNSIKLQRSSKSSDGVRTQETLSRSMSQHEDQIETEDDKRLPLNSALRLNESKRWLKNLDEAKELSRIGHFSEEMDSKGSTILKGSIIEKIQDGEEDLQMIDKKEAYRKEIVDRNDNIFIKKGPANGKSNRNFFFASEIDSKFDFPVGDSNRDDGSGVNKKILSLKIQRSHYKVLAEPTDKLAPFQVFSRSNSLTKGQKFKKKGNMISSKKAAASKNKKLESENHFNDQLTKSILNIGFPFQNKTHQQNPKPIGLYNLAEKRPLNSNMSSAFAKFDTSSIDGDVINVSKGEHLVVTRELPKKHLVECLYDDKIGLFRAEDLTIIKNPD